MKFPASAAPLALIAAMLVGTLSACDPNTGTNEQSADGGEALFEKNCSVCHGEQGRGPSMADIRALSPDGLRSAIRNHPTAGQIPQRLPAAEVQQLIEFLEE